MESFCNYILVYVFLFLHSSAQLYSLIIQEAYEASERLQIIKQNRKKRDVIWAS